MELTGRPETSARNYHYSARNSPEESSSHHRGGKPEIVYDIQLLVIILIIA